jgi:hypothetical protein
MAQKGAIRQNSAQKDFFRLRLERVLMFIVFPFSLWVALENQV